MCISLAIGIQIKRPSIKEAPAWIKMFEYHDLRYKDYFPRLWIGTYLDWDESMTEYKYTLKYIFVRLSKRK